MVNGRTWAYGTPQKGLKGRAFYCSSVEAISWKLRRERGHSNSQSHVETYHSQAVVDAVGGRGGEKKSKVTAI